MKSETMKSSGDTAKESVTKLGNLDPRDVFSAVKDQFGKAQETVVSMVKEAIPENIEETGKQIASKTTQMAQTATKLIKKHPYQAALIGLGLGVVIGALWRSPKYA